MVVDEDSSKVATCLKKYICGIENVAEKKMTKEEFRKMLHDISDIYEEQRMRKILNINALICFGAAVFLHAFWA